MALIVPPARLIALGLLVSCAGAIQQGYLLAVLNPTKFALQPFTNGSFDDHYDEYITAAQFSSLWSTMVSSVTLGSMFGAMALPLVAQKIGRRNGIWVTTIFSIVFAALEGVSKYADSWELYFACRFLLGFSVGIALGVQAIYLTEITPKECRGFMNSLTGMAMAFPEPLAAALGLSEVVGNSRLWPLLHFVQIPVLMLPLFLLLWYPESPKMLYSQGHEKRARESVAYFYGRDADIDLVIEEIKQELQASRMSIGQIFRNPDVRKAVIVASVLSFGNGFSGGQSVLFYASSLLKKMGFSQDIATYANIPITAMVFAATLVVVFTADKMGRRKLMLLGTFSLIILNSSALILSLLFEHYGLSWLGYLFLINELLILFAFGVSFAPIALFIAAELSPQNARSGAQSVAVFVRNLSIFAGGSIFYPFNQKAGGYSFFLFIVPLVSVFVVLYFTMPETKGRTYAEILEAWNKLPGGVFSTSRVVPVPATIELGRF